MQSAQTRVTQAADPLHFKDVPLAGAAIRRTRMGSIETSWFDVLVVRVSSPSVRPLLKVAIVLAGVLALAQTAGRSWA
jgi:hypothetical protein